VIDVLSAFCGAVHAVPSRLVNVPELHPPVDQERILCYLVLGQLWCRHVRGGLLLHGADAIGFGLGAELLRLLRVHPHFAVEHGLCCGIMLVAQEVVVDVRVELLARVHGLALVGVWHVAHDGGAVNGPSVGAHGRHLRHLGGLHRDAGRVRRAASGAVGGSGWSECAQRWRAMYAMSRAHLGAAVDVVIMTWTAVATGVWCRGGSGGSRRPGVVVGGDHGRWTTRDEKKKTPARGRGCRVAMEGGR
jgi:hypothetical protein